MTLEKSRGEAIAQHGLKNRLAASSAISVSGVRRSQEAVFDVPVQLRDLMCSVRISDAL